MVWTTDDFDFNGEFYQLSLLPRAWLPPQHEFTDIKIDISAVGDWMALHPQPDVDA